MSSHLTSDIHWHLCSISKRLITLIEKELMCMCVESFFSGYTHTDIQKKPEKKKTMMISVIKMVLILSIEKIKIFTSTSHSSTSSRYLRMTVSVVDKWEEEEGKICTSVCVRANEREKKKEKREREGKREREREKRHRPSPPIRHFSSDNSIRLVEMRKSMFRSMIILIGTRKDQMKTMRWKKKKTKKKSNSTVRGKRRLTSTS